MGRTKRKNISPLQKDGGKSRRTIEDATVSDTEEDGGSQVEQGDVIADLKEFIRNENSRSNRKLAEDIRKFNDERMTALENSLSFALTTNEVLAKRLGAVEEKAKQTEKDFGLCVQRLSELEGELDQMQQRELRDWLIFSGPAVPRLARGGGGQNEDASRLLLAMVKQLMDFSMDMQQIAELHREERQIRVRFSAVGAGSDRYLLIRNRTRLRGTGLYIRERLTPVRQRIYNELMQLKWNNKVNTVFTKDGTVFVVVGERDRPRPVRSEATLERLSRHLAESASGGHRVSPGHRAQRSDLSTEAIGRGRESTVVVVPVADPGGDASGAAGHSGSPPGRAPDGAGRSAERGRRGSAGRPAERERGVAAAPAG